MTETTAKPRPSVATVLGAAVAAIVVTALAALAISTPALEALDRRFADDAGNVAAIDGAHAYADVLDRLHVLVDDGDWHAVDAVVAAEAVKRRTFVDQLTRAGLVPRAAALAAAIEPLVSNAAMLGSRHREHQVAHGMLKAATDQLERSAHGLEGELLARPDARSRSMAIAFGRAHDRLAATARDVVATGDVKAVRDAKQDLEALLAQAANLDADPNPQQAQLKRSGDLIWQSAMQLAATADGLARGRAGGGDAQERNASRLHVTSELPVDVRGTAAIDIARRSRFVLRTRGVAAFVSLVVAIGVVVVEHQAVVRPLAQLTAQR